MKAYKVIFTNEPFSADGGSLYHKCLVFAESFSGAVMEAEEALLQLRDAMIRVGLPERAYKTLDIDTVEYECQIVGRFAFLHSDEDRAAGSITAWAQRVAKRVKKDTQE
jgi:hypothetical protein